MDRLIHTGLFTDTAADAIYHGVIGQCSDGRGEDNPKNAKYWRFISVKRAEDGEVLLEVKSGYDLFYEVESAFAYKSEFEVREWVANYLKATVKLHMKDDSSIGKWVRSNGNYTCYADVKVNEAYLVYEILKGRSRAKDKYATDLIEKVIGHRLTPEAIALREAIKKINAKLADDLKALEAKHAADVSALKAAAEAEISKLKAA